MTGIGVGLSRQSRCLCSFWLQQMGCATSSSRIGQAQGQPHREVTQVIDLKQHNAAVRPSTSQKIFIPTNVQRIEVKPLHPNSTAAPILSDGRISYRDIRSASLHSLAGSVTSSRRFVSVSIGIHSPFQHFPGCFFATSFPFLPPAMWLFCSNCSDRKSVNGPSHCWKGENGFSSGSSFSEFVFSLLLSNSSFISNFYDFCAVIFIRNREPSVFQIHVRFLCSFSVVLPVVPVIFSIHLIFYWFFPSILEYLNSPRRFNLQIVIFSGACRQHLVQWLHPGTCTSRWSRGVLSTDSTTVSISVSHSSPLPFIQSINQPFFRGPERFHLSVARHSSLCKRDQQYLQYDRRDSSLVECQDGGGLTFEYQMGKC